MAMTSDLYRGMVIKWNGQPHIMVEKEFAAMGKGSGFNRVRLKNIKTGKFFNEHITSGVKVEEIDVTTKNVQFIYVDGVSAVFMDPVTYEQISFPLESIPGKTDWLHGDAKYVAQIYEDEVINLLLPPKMTLEITETYDAVKGDTATGAKKDAVLETGATVKVPLFIKQGEKIIVNTEDGAYFSKAN